MNLYLGVLQQYVAFSGRSRRKEYWIFMLISILISVALGYVDGILGTTAILGLGTPGLLGGLYSLAVLLPGLGVTVRRLHDAGKSAWWLLIGLIPLIGAIILIVFLAKPSEKEANKYGENPTLV